MIRLACVVQGMYYLLIGLWPLLSIETFLAVTGPKTDIWLVHTVGVLVILIGAVLLYSAAKHEIVGPVWLLALGTAAMLILIECFYALQGVIWRTYLLDAIGEVLIIALWMAGMIRERNPMSGSRGSQSSSTAPSRSAKGLA